jgi:ubiquinone/menaquinone biosynthesis C-methylase UbiE
MTDYSSLSYWENRYTNEHLEIFEWYQTYETLKEKIGEYFKTTDKVLNVGCGTSKFAEDLYIDDIKDVTNIDFSENAIKIMVEYYQEQQVEMNYKKMDVCEMTEFADKTFDVVFDKALLDAMLCGENALITVEKMMKEIYRVLKDEGFYIIISNTNEDGRKLLFDNQMWEYSVMEIEKPSKVLVIEDKDPKNFHYIYILKKKVVEPPPKEEPEEKKEEEKKEVKKDDKKDGKKK